MSEPVTAPTFGVNNANLDESIDRITTGGSWKSQRIVVVIPTGDMVPTRAMVTWWSLMFPPNQPWLRYPVIGMEVGEAYSSAIDDGILKHPDLKNWEYVLTLEHDSVVYPTAVMDLLRAMEEHPEYAAISGLYWTKGEGTSVPQIWGDPSRPLNFAPQPPRPNEVVECTGIAMGFALWRMELFKDKRLSRPLFKTKAGTDGFGTQDLAFATEAKKYGYRFAVDCRVKIGHLDYNGSFGPKDTVY